MTRQATDTLKAEYEALRTGTAVLGRQDADPIRVRGSDRADFLHRMTTNDINSLASGQSVVTILTTPTARIQFVFTVICRTDDVLLLPTPGESAALARYLRGQIFFMDQVEIESLPSSRWRVMGPKSMDVLAALELSVPAPDRRAWREVDGVLVLAQHEYDVPGYELVSPPGAADDFLPAMQQAGAAILTTDAAYNARRVELGRPIPGRELTGEYNPLEAGMQWACADNKGCYTGQEIIARQVTYDKVTKTLVGLRCQAAVGIGETVSVDSASAGLVTSYANSPALGRHLALAIVRRPYNAPGVRVAAGSVEAHVTALPFAEKS